MKQWLLLLAVFGLLRTSTLSAQPTTIVLLRHAEKDTTTAGATMMQADPPLSIAGQARAAALPGLLAEYHADVIFSTDYIRTKATVAPLAKKWNKAIELYDPRQLSTLAERLKLMRGQTIIVAGHSNTTPALVNLLIGENKYPNLDDRVYNHYWVVSFDKGKAVAEERVF